MIQTLRGTSLVVATLTVAALTLFGVVVASHAVLGAGEADAEASVASDDGTPGAVLAQEDDEGLDAPAPDDEVADDVAEGLDEDLAEVTITYELVLGRDPFESIRPEPEPVVETPPLPTDPALPGVPTDPTDPARPADPADPARPGDPSRPTDPADPSRPADPAAPDSVCTDEVDGVCEGKRLALVEILTGDSARLRVEGSTYDVDEGQRFAEDFVLLEVDGRCVTVLFADGDETQRYRLCEPTAK